MNTINKAYKLNRPIKHKDWKEWARVVYIDGNLVFFNEASGRSFEKQIFDDSEYIIQYDAFLSYTYYLIPTTKVMTYNGKLSSITFAFLKYKYTLNFKNK
jgi:hypothetical protein